MAKGEKGTEPSRGFLTTEFYVAALLIVVSAAMVLFGDLDAKDWLEYSKWPGGAFILSRGVSKLGS